MFKPVDPKQSFPKMEEALVKYWKENKIFEKSVEKPAGNEHPKDYVFYDGPPFATGLPHYGHLLAGTLKDVVPRYWTMQGYRIERKWGWDCHGLPVENLIEKELGLKSKKDIEEMGVAKFNEACRASVLRYEKEWKKTVPRMGRWIDMENDYKTMDTPFMESVWWVFKSLYDKGLVYEGRRSIHICPRCETPLSNFEVGQGYMDITDHSATAKFELIDEPGTFVLAWTTTPWTLPGNVALAVGKEIDYVKVFDPQKNESYILAKDIYDQWSQDKGSPLYDNISDNVPKEVKNAPTIEKIIRGSDLQGKRYKPLFDYFVESDLENMENAYRIVVADFVSTEEGTGVVHIAPAFGEDDMQTGIDRHLPFIQHVNMDGTFIQAVKDWEGKDCKKMDQNIIASLKEKSLMFWSGVYKHSYPHCWRCDTPLLNYATASWFIAASQLREKMLKSNESIHWSPTHIKEGRFGKWVAAAKDWSISRGRYWGTPIPIWRNEEDPEDVIVVGSIEELHKLSGKKVNDLHKHFVDEVVIEKGGKTYKRIPDVFDCWVESGAMPYGQWHYPFENKEKFEATFPADYIAEGVDHTRCWFYVLHVLSNALFDKPAFKNVIVNGIVLAEDGRKMSKRLKNYPDPHEVMDNYGADALRFYLLNSPVVMATDMRFSEKGVEQVLRNMLIPLWNAYSFFVTYSNIDKWTPEKQVKNSPNKLDTWIIAELNQLIAEQIEFFKNYDLQKASNAIYKFTDDLTNWYIRRSRRRFWKSEDDEDKNHAYSTLYTVLTKLCQVLAPFMPFMPEEIYKNLTGEESVHLTAYPKPDPKVYDKALMHETHLAKTIVSLGLAARAKQKIKVRQPLQKIDIVLSDPGDQALIADQIETIKEELNIKEVEFIDNPDTFATKIAKPDAKVLGPKYGKQVQDIIQAAKQGDFEELGNGNIKVLMYELTPEEISIDYIPKGDFDVESAEGILIALETKITTELKQEGAARDLVRQIQDLRKKANYKVNDRIEVSISGAEETLLKNFGDYIKNETLATALKTEIEAPDETAEYEGMVIQVKK
ncbi:isoleucine--tRNA ligase [Candidatus Peregrinibacteria bacterium CG_4_10_14_0_2_um_filter_43_11]|nr:MAG: isoleucine--tRNA ligase [Candidatus Peregrinibacteria bacterium CG_4_10_14_0_2_um_filter_43_11]